MNRLRHSRNEEERVSSEAPFRDRLLFLLALDVVSCVVAGTAAGAFHVSRTNVLIAFAAATIAIGATQAFRVPGTRRAQEEPASPRQFRQSRRILLLVMLVGLVGYVGGSATFAIFSAETGNPNGSVGSGTLTLGDQVNNATTCQSYAGATVDNYNYACDALLTLTNMAPGVASGTATGYAQAKLTIQNGGSIDASRLYVSAPYPSATLGSSLSGTVNTLTFSTGFNVALSTGDTIRVAYGGNSTDFTVSGSYAAGATSVTVSSVNLGSVTYPVASRVQDRSGNTVPSNTDCYDAKTASAPASVPTATYGTQLNFNSPTGNPLCQAMLFWIQEQSASGKNYCWYGRGSSASPSPSSVGQCRTPTLATLSGTLSTGGTISSLPVQALTGNVKSGDVILLTQGTSTQSYCASANAFIGDTSITVGSTLNTGETTCPGTGGTTPNFAYTSAATVKDSTAFSALDGDTTDTISNFDTGHPETGRIQLYPVVSNNTVDTTASVQLNKSGDSGSQRIFYIGVYMPAPSGTPQNQLQGLVSKFGLTWHIDQ